MNSHVFPLHFILVRIDALLDRNHFASDASILLVWRTRRTRTGEWHFYSSVLHSKAFFCVTAPNKWMDLELRRWRYSNVWRTRNLLWKKVIGSNAFVTWRKQPSMEPWLKRFFTYPYNIGFAEQSRWSWARMSTPMEVWIFLLFKPWFRFFAAFQDIHHRAQRDAYFNGELPREYYWPTSFPHCTPSLRM